MPIAREWADTFEEGIKAYGFSEDQIHRHTDADHDTMHDAISEGPNSARIKIKQNASQGRRTLLLCFYVGHGATQNYSTYVLLNCNQRADPYVVGDNQYNLEH